MSGDMAALTQYTPIAEQAEALSDKLEKTSSSLTTAQMNRLFQIALKAATALTE